MPVILQKPNQIRRATTPFGEKGATSLSLGIIQRVINRRGGRRCPTYERIIRLSITSHSTPSTLQSGPVIRARLPEYFGHRGQDVQQVFTFSRLARAAHVSGAPGVVGHRRTDCAGAAHSICVALRRVIGAYTRDLHRKLRRSSTNEGRGPCTWAHHNCRFE